MQMLAPHAIITHVYVCVWYMCVFNEQDFASKGNVVIERYFPGQWQSNEKLKNMSVHTHVPSQSYKPTMVGGMSDMGSESNYRIIHSPHC